MTVCLVLMFSDISIFFSILNHVDMCGIFSVSFVLGLESLPEEGSSLLPKSSVLSWVFCNKGKSSCKCP